MVRVGDGCPVCASGKLYPYSFPQDSSPYYPDPKSTILKCDRCAFVFAEIEA
jgi:C4-type Zn-finger protein